MDKVEPDPADPLDTEELTYNSKHGDPLGDCELLCADGVRFRVMKYHIMSSSTTFSDLLQLSDTASPSSTDPPRPVLTFVDSRMESEIHIAAWLDIMQNKISITRKELPFRTLSALIRFADKWECHLLKQYLLASLITYVETDPPASEKNCRPDILVCAFTIACEYRRPDICAALLRSPHMFLKTKHEVSGAKRHVLDPLNLPLFSHKLIPATYMCALTQAWAAAIDQSGDDECCQTDIDRIPELFAQRLDVLESKR